MGIMDLIMASVDHSSHVDELWHEVEPALKFAEKTGNLHALGTFTASGSFAGACGEAFLYRQL